MKHNQGKLTTRLSACALLLGGILQNSAYSQTDDIENMIITASRTPMNIDEAFSTLEVISRQQIDMFAPQSLSELLSTVAGIDISVQGGRGQNASVFIRGANSNQSLVLIDGLRVSSASLGSSNLQIIAPELIERIEIIKGPRAAIWGSDAIGGVINIITRQNKENALNLSINTGSDSYQKVSLSGARSHEKGFTSLSGNYEKSDGFDVLKTAEPDKDGFDTHSFALNGEYKVNNKLNIHYLARADQLNSEYDNAFGGNNQSENKNHIWLLKTRYDHQVNNSKAYTEFTIGQNRDYSKNFRTDATSGFDSVFETRRDQLSVLNSIDASSTISLNSGIDYYKEQLNSTSTFTENSRDVVAVYGHGFYRNDNLSAELAVRYDSIENIDAETTYNLGFAYQFNTNTRIAISTGTGFKAPSFNDLYFPAGTFSAGNPELNSERSQGSEINLTTRVNDINVDLSLFKNEIDELIVWTADENFFFQPNNIDKAEISGFELQATYSGAGGQHSLGASYIDAKDQSTGLRLIRRAREQFSYQFETKINKINVFLNYQYNGSRIDSDFVLGRIKLDAFHLVNINARYEFSRQLSINLKISNALDEAYQTAFNYRSQNRNITLGLNYQL